MHNEDICSNKSNKKSKPRRLDVLFMHVIADQLRFDAIIRSVQDELYDDEKY